MLQCKQSASTCKGPVSKKSNSRITSSRETKILLFKLGQTYTRSEYPKHSSRIRDSLSRKPCRMGQQNSKKFETSEQFHPYQHFKMKGLNLLQNMLQKGDYMCKLDLKDAYFCVPLKKESGKYVRFQWEVTLYEFLCLCFGLGPASLIFTKILKVQISLFM